MLTAFQGGTHLWGLGTPPKSSASWDLAGEEHGEGALAMFVARPARPPVETHEKKCEK